MRYRRMRCRSRSGGSAGGRSGITPECRGGFTLLEVMVALVLTGLILLGARQVLEQMTETSHTLTASAAAIDEEANAERLLRALVGQLEVGTAGTHEFSGTPLETEFTSWCDVPAGWQERCDVRLAIDTVDAAAIGAADGTAGELALTATTRLLRTAAQASDTTRAAGERLVLRRGFQWGALRYLNWPDTGGEWFRAWGRGITAPLALGVILQWETHADTLILRIGERG